MRRSLFILFGFCLSACMTSGFGTGQDPAMNERMNQKLATVTSESTS